MLKSASAWVSAFKPVARACKGDCAPKRLKVTQHGHLRTRQRTCSGLARRSVAARDTPAAEEGRNWHCADAALALNLTHCFVLFGVENQQRASEHRDDRAPDLPLGDGLTGGDRVHDKNDRRHCAKVGNGLMLCRLCIVN